MAALENPYHLGAAPLRDDAACERCIAERAQRYRQQHRSWSEAERRKYARFKCSARPGVDAGLTPCRGQPHERLEAPWLHAVVLLALLAGALWLLRDCALRR